MVCSAASFHHDAATRYTDGNFKELCPADPPAQHWPPALVDSVKLEDVLARPMLNKTTLMFTGRRSDSFSSAGIFEVDVARSNYPLRMRCINSMPEISGLGASKFVRPWHRIVKSRWVS
jgi:hypothetical protein